MDYNSAIEKYAKQARREGVQIKMREPGANPLFSKKVGWRVGIAVTLSAAMIVFAVIFNKPNVYGYINARPITSKAEAIEYSQELLSNLAIGKGEQEDIFKGIMSLD